MLDPDTPTLADGCDTLRGGGGDDVLQNVNGGPGGCRDLVDYSDHAGPVHVTLNGGPTTGNGEGAENDFVATAFADVLGTAQGDTIDASGDAHPHTLFGGGGVDTLTGGSGDDTLEGGAGNDLLDGGGGADTASYAERSANVEADLDGVNDDGVAGEADQYTSIENLTGGSGADKLTGDGGPNTLKGGDGSDNLIGGDGADNITSRDAFADTVACGSASDSVVSDVLDTVNADCEAVDDGVDNDGVPDSADNCPTVSNRDQLNSDGAADGGDACDTDDDNDGVVDSADAFPLDPSESVDTDGDGQGDNADQDDDNDGVGTRPTRSRSTRRARRCRSRARTRRRSRSLRLRLRLRQAPHPAPRARRTAMTC